MPLPRLKTFGCSALAILMLAAGCRKSPIEPPRLDPVDPATVLFVDDFDAENGGAGRFNYTAFANWNVQDGCVDLHGNGFIDVQPGKGLYVDLDGTCKPSKAGTMETKAAFSLDPGSYVLEFWLAGNQRIPSPDTVLVSLGDLHQEQIVLTRDEPFRLFTRNLTVSTPTTARLRFRNLGGDDQGALLDLVRLRRAN
ncbi:hypothetical protein BH23GEM3_BH23GEM3_14980 [soil metagenome]|nr:hypothetical protein [Gemmatimonadota bacterium]